MADPNTIYICRKCFEVFQQPVHRHEDWIISCSPGEMGSDCRKPLTDAFGQMVSRAPRWYLEATGAIPAYTPFHREKEPRY